MSERCFTAPDLHKIGVLMPLTDNGDPQHWKAMACAALLAVAHFNARDGSVVPAFSQSSGVSSLAFNLSARLYDTAYTPNGAVEAFRVAQDAGSAGLVGPYRSASSISLYPRGDFLDLPLVSYGSTSVVLSNKPAFSRTVPTDEDSAAVVVSAIGGFGWRNFNIVHVNDAWGSPYAQLIAARAAACGLNPPLKIKFEYDDEQSAREAVRTLSKQPQTIVVLLAFVNDLPGIFNEADALGLLSGSHAWIGSRSFSPASVNALVDAGRISNTTRDKLEGMLQAGHAPNTESFGLFKQSFARLSPKECEAMDPQLGGMEPSTFADPPENTAYAFDATATVALALREQREGNLTSANLSTAELLRRVSFEGASGAVSFGGEGHGAGDRNVASLSSELRSWRQEDGAGELDYVPLPLEAGANPCFATLTPEAAAGMVWLGGGSTPPRDAILVAEEEERRRRDEAQALVWKLCVGVGVPGLLLLACGVALLFYSFRLQSRRKQLLWRHSRLPLRFSHTAPGGKYHLFLSHTWLSGQDQVHLIKRRLSTLAPGMDIFLDVDNLQEFGSLADEVAASDVVLLFLSRGYFASKACAIEYEAAVRLGKPLILVHEANENKGGLPLQQARRDCPEAIRDEIFGTSRPVVSWQRSDAFQQVALKRIVAEVLVACGCDLPRSDLRVARRSSDDATATPLASLRSTPHAARRSTPHDAAAEATAASRSAASPSAAPSAASGPARIEEEEVESGALGGRGGVVVIGTLLGVSSAGAGSGADSRADAGNVTASGIVHHRSLGASSAGAGRRPLPAPKETRPAPGSGGGASRWTRGLWHSSRASGEEAAAGGRLGGGKGGRGGISGISLGSDALYLHTEARLAARLQGGRLVLAFSRHNPGAREIALEVASLVAGCSAAEWPLAGPLDGRVVPLLLLDATTFGGDCGEDLADDVRQWCAQVAASREPPQEECSAVALRPSFSSSLGGSSRRSGGGRAASPKRRNSLSRRPSLSRLPSLSCARGPVEPPLLLHAALAEETRGCPVRRGIPRAAHQLKIAVIGGRLPLRGGDAAHADRPRARVPLHADRAAVVRAARLQKGGAGRALAGARPAKPRRLSRDNAAGRLQLRCPAPQTAYLHTRTGLEAVLASTFLRVSGLLYLSKCMRQ